MKLTDLRQEFLMGEDRPFESCHASTLLKLKNGDILTVANINLQVNIN